MTQADATAAIFARWLALWPTLQPTVDFTVDNVVKTEPDDASFARVGVTELDSLLYTLGPRGLQQRRAYIDVRLTGPVNVGRRPLDLLIDSIRKIYERKRFANDPGIAEYGIVTFATSVRALRKDKDNPQLWVLSTLTPCEWYENTPTT